MKRIIHLLIPLLILASTTVGLIGTAQASDYTQNELMDDPVFNNVNSLTAPQIASFLGGGPGPFTSLSQPSACLNSYTSPNFYWDGTTWHYGTDSNWNNAWGPAQIGVATVVYQAAQMWGINPEVILATLQKEESLVTGTSCDSGRYTAAMGYGCPDGGGCNSTYAGFSKQVLWGAYQLEFNLQRSYGNTSWDGDNSLMYVGYMTQGYRAQCGTCTSEYYDGYATIDGQSVYMTNGATASLYSYTPHVGQSFPGIFEGWFGSTITPTYGANTVGQSASPTIIPGNTATGYLEYQNTGNQTWYDDDSIGSAPSGTDPVHLATSDPVNRTSPFGATWGVGGNRPATTFAAVYDSDGATLASNQHEVTNGEIAKFSFTFTVAPNQAPGSYVEHFTPVAEGTPTGAFSDPGTYLVVTVAPATFTAQYVGQSNYPSILPGNTATGYFEYQNEGNQTWYDDNSVGSATPGTYSVHLATSHPVNRASVFGATWAAGHNRPSLNFAAVYDSDGVTLAPNQNEVTNGEIAKFSFTLTVAPNQAPGVYQEYFMPVAEGTPTGAFNDPGTYLNVTVLPATYAAQYVGQSNYPSIAQGSTGTGYFEYQNAGNETWYDDNSVGSAPAGTGPVHLATSHPINRASVFGATWAAGHNRPDLTFSAVYDSDGVTLAPNQDEVTPGEIAKFNITFTVSASQAPGVYQEYFMPIVEGTSGLFNDPGTYLYVTVTP